MTVHAAQTLRVNIQFEMLNNKPARTPVFLNLENPPKEGTFFIRTEELPFGIFRSLRVEAEDLKNKRVRLKQINCQVIGSRGNINKKLCRPGCNHFDDCPLATAKK